MSQARASTYSTLYSTPFIGRAQELADIAARLAGPDCRLLTLTGLGGSGKTRLALEAARHIAPQFLHGTVFVGLQPLTRIEQIVPAIAQALGISFYGDGELRDQLIDYLRDKALLLILDNFEHLLDGAGLLADMLAAAPGVRVLATSREALCLQEEWLCPLQGLAMPPSVYATLVEDYDAVQLFLFHARRMQPAIDLSGDRESIIQICRLTAGLPLAIELAATWLKGSSVAQIVREAQRSIDVLSATTRNGEERHRSMRAIFDQSWALLSEDERRVFARLAVFCGSFAAESAAQVAGASFAGLAGLVEKALVQIDGDDRFSIHELLRQYGLERLAAYGETEDAYARHSQHFAQQMRQHEAALKQPQQLVALRAIGRDFDNIRMAWEWSARRQELDNLHALLDGLYLFGFLGGRYREAMALFQDCLDAPLADGALRGRLLARRWGYLHWWYQADYQLALEQIEQALAIADAQGNRFELAFGQLMSAYAMINLRRYDDALLRLEASQALFEELGEPYYVCWVLHRRGYAYSCFNDIAHANAYAEQSLAIARAIQDRVALITCLNNLGVNAILAGDYAAGQQLCAEALQVATGVGHQDLIADVLSLLALCAFGQGDYAACWEHAARSQTISETVNLSAFLPYSLVLLILVACVREEYAEGARLSALARRHRANVFGQQLLHWAHAALACGAGRPDEAREQIGRVLQIWNVDAQLTIAMWLVPCAAYALAPTEPALAAELLAWSLSYPDPALRWARDWPLLGRVQAQLRGTLGEDAYALRWGAGLAHTPATVTRAILEIFGAEQAVGTPPAPAQLLTAREHDILRLMAAGLTNPQIAARLIIGAGTVKTHTLNIYRKLEVANRAQAIRRAQELGLLGR